MSNTTLEQVGVPDGDGDDYVRIGIGEAELLANATSPMEVTEESVVHGGRTLYADPSYDPLAKAKAKAKDGKPAERPEQGLALPDNWMSGMAVEGASLVATERNRQRRMARHRGKIVLNPTRRNY